MIDIVSKILDRAKMQHLTIATAESCTGGMVAAALTSIPGSSAVLDRGWVTYSNHAKRDELGVPMDLINAHGAVSEQVAVAMAEGALSHSTVDIAVSITGIAGPDGGTADKPVGLVYFACAMRGHQTIHLHHIFLGNRNEIRRQAANAALTLLDKRLS